MAYTNIVKALPVHRLLAFIERRENPNGEFTDKFGSYDKIEHYLFATKSGVLIDIQPTTGIVRTIISNSYSSGVDNLYPLPTYAWKNNKIIVQDGEASRNSPNVTIYDPVTGHKEFVDMWGKVARFNHFAADVSILPFYRALISSDGNVLGSCIRQRAAPSTWYYNSETNTFDFYNKDSLPVLSQRHNLRSVQAITITSTSGFDGTYHTGWWSDDGDNIFTTFINECVASGITPKGSHRFFIHDSDRAVNSSSRRVIASLLINGIKAWYIVNVKDPLIFYKANMATSDGSDIYNNVLSATWVNQSGVTKSTSGWSKGNLMDEPFASATTIVKPTYDSLIFYTNSFVCGRFGYTVGYIANKVYNFALPIALQTEGSFNAGDIIIPTNWPVIDVGSTFYNGALVNYECNMRGVHGFSNNDEYVTFFKHPVSNLYGYLAPDTLDWIAYDPTLSSNLYSNGGYVKRGPLDLNKGEFGCYYDDITVVTGTVDIEGEPYFYDNVFNQMTSVLKKDFMTYIYQDQEVCDVSFTMIPDPAKPWQKYTNGVSNVPTTNGDLLNTTEMGANQLLFAGITYSGIVYKNRETDNSLTRVYEWNQVLSYKGSLKISDTKIVYYGYLGKIDYIDLELPSSSSLTAIAINNVAAELNYVSLYDTNTLLITGHFVRTANYIGGYGAFGYSDLTTKTSKVFPNQPVEYKHLNGQVVRRAFGLTASSYSDSEAEAIFAASIITQGLTRAQGIAALKNSVSWVSQGCEAYKDGSGKLIVSLEWSGISGLIGFRINDNANGSGLWHTANTTPGTSSGTSNFNIYPRAIFINKPDGDLDSLLESDYKTVQFTDLLNKIYPGRLAISDNYIVYLDHEHSNSRAVVRIISKTNFETAANGTGSTTFDSTVNIPLNNTGTTYGFGSQGGSYSFFATSGTPRNSFFTVGDYLFATISTNVGSSPYQAVIRVDLAAGTFVTWCTDTVKQAARGITYNATTDTAFVTRDSTTFRVTNFTTLTPPYNLV